MPWMNWFRKRFARRALAAKPRRRIARLGLETLEERATPAVNTTLVSVPLPSLGGDAPTITSGSTGASFSADGKLLVFSSDASNLVTGDTNGVSDIFLANLTTGAVVRVSVLADNTQANGPSLFPSISADGRYVAFQSSATNLVTGDANDSSDIFVKDLQSGAVTLISAAAGGAIGDDFSRDPAISADGNSVVFSSFASNLTTDDTDHFLDVFRKNVQSGQIDLVSKTSAGVKGDADSISDAGPAISSDGRYIAFGTNATNFLPAGGDGNGKADIYRKDMTSGDLVLVSADATGTIGNDDSTSPLISADGNTVVFGSAASNLIANDTNAKLDVFAKNLTTQTVTRASVAADGSELASDSLNPSVNGDGTKISFVTMAAVAAGDANQANDVYLRDISQATTTRLSTRSDGSEAPGGGDGGRLSPNGASVAFSSETNDFNAGDGNSLADVYVKNLSAGTVTMISKGLDRGGDSFLWFDVPQLSADANSVIFVSGAGNLIPGADANGNLRDIYLRNISQGTTTRISSSAAGVQGNGDSSTLALNPTGVTPFVAFSSTSTNLTAGNTNGFEQVYLKDPASGLVIPISTNTNGNFGDNDSYNPVISGNGQFVAFISYASNLFDDSTAAPDVVVKNLTTGAVTVVTADENGAQINGNISEISISDDGRYVAFATDANDASPDDANGQFDIYVKDLVSGTLTLVSQSGAGTVGNGNSTDPVLSADGRYIAFISTSNNLVTGDTNSTSDAFRSDWQAGAHGTIVRVNTAADGSEADDLTETISLSGDGRFVAFGTFADNLLAGDDNGVEDVYLKDVDTGTVYLASQNSAGTIGNNHSVIPSLSRDGRSVAYTSLATNLASGAPAAFANIFVTTLNRAPVIALTGLTSINEGDSLSLDATGSTDPDNDTLTYAWDLNGDGVFGDAVGASFTLNAAQLDALGLADGPNLYHAQLAVSDAFGAAVHAFDIAIANVAPTATIIPEMVGSFEGETVTFNASATDPSLADVADGGALHWEVRLDGGPYIAGDGVPFIFDLDDDGDYEVTLFADDKDGGEDIATYSFSVANRAPTVAALNAPATGAAGTLISFPVAASDVGHDDQAAGLTIAWAVTKNGAPYANGMGATVAFTPDAAGSYDVTVTATDKDQATSAPATATIDVTASSLTAIITPGTVGTLEGQTATFTGRATDSGGVDVPGASLHWDVMRNGSAATSGNGASFSFPLADDGAYLVTLTVSDGTGQGTATNSFTVANVAPTIGNLNAPATGVAGTLISFTPTVTDAGPADQTAGFTVAWSVKKDGGAFASGAGPVSFTPDAAGSYEVTVTATDKDLAASAPATATINVTSNQLTAVITPGTVGTLEGETASFTGRATDSGGADVAGASFHWDVLRNGSAATSGNGASFSFPLSDDGAYFVTLTVSDGASQGTANYSFTVANQAPTVGALNAPATGVEGTAISFTPAVTDAGSADQTAGFTYSWNVTKNGAPFANGTSASVSFTPNDNASYDVQFTAKDKDLATSSVASATIVVANAAPSVNTVNAPASGVEGTLISFTPTASDPGSADQTAGLTLTWSVKKDDAPFASGTGTVAFTPDDNGSYDVQVTARDKDLADSLAATATIAVTNVAPTATITPGTVGAFEGDSASFTGSAADVSSVDVAAGITLHWDATRNGAALASGDGASFSLTLPDNGDYVVTLTATDKDGGHGTKTHAFTVANRAPTLTALNAPTTGVEGSLISFTPTASDVGSADVTAGLSYAWTVTKNGAPFTTGSGAVVSFTPNDNGSYEVVVIARDKDNAESTSLSATIVVANVAPTAVITPGIVGSFEGETASFTSESTDPGGADVTGLILEWDVTRNGVPLTSGTGAVFSFNLDDNGNYLVTLVATDKDNGVGTTAYSFDVSNRAPTVTAVNAPAAGVEGTPISFTAAASDPGPNDEAAGLTFAWSVAKDGAFYVSGMGATVTFTPDDNATYEVTITATDKDLTASPPAKATIVVANVAPNLNISSTATINEGAAYSLALAATDPGADTISSWDINWGDGSATETIPGTATAATHVFADGPAQWTIQVTAHDEDGQYNASQDITVHDVAPTVALTGAVAAIVNVPYQLHLGALVDPGQDPASSVVIQWGDNTSDTVPLDGFNQTYTHTYTDLVTVTIQVSVTNADGTFDAASKSVEVVVDAPPTANIDGPATIAEGSTYTLDLAVDNPAVRPVTSYTIAWGDGETTTANGEPPATATHVYANGATSRTITVTLFNGDSAYANPATQDVAVTNVAPDFDAGSDATLDEGSHLTRSGGFTDPGADTWTATVDYGDGGGAQPLTLVGQHYVLGHTYANQGTFTVTVSISDGEATTAHSFVLTVVNVAPDVNVGANTATLNEGDTLVRDGSFTDPGADTWTATVNYGDGAGAVPLTLQGKQFTLNHVYPQDGLFTIAVTVSDGTTSTTQAFTLTVANVTPSLTLSSDIALPASGVLASEGFFTDPGDDTWVVTANYGDNTGDQPVTLNGKHFTLQHTYTQAGSYTVTVTVNDGVATNSDSFVATKANDANNTAPVITLAPTGTANEGSTFTATGSFTDPDTNTWTATVDYGLGAGPVPLTLAADKTFSLSQVYPQNGSFTITVTISDGFASRSATTAVTVANVAPTVSAGANGSAIVGSAFTRTGSFTDPGTDTWTATVNYGDGGGAVSLTLATDKTFALIHTYSQTGTFPVTVTVNDGTAAGTATFNLQVVNLGLSLTGSTVVEKAANGTIVGALTTGDAGIDSTATFTLTDNAGGRFALNGRNVVVADGTLLNYATATSHTIHARVTSGGQTVDKDFTIQVAQNTIGDDFVGRDAITGELYVAASTGAKFITTNYQGIFNPSKNWVDVGAADFDGDGRDDVIARDNDSGEWWLARNTGTTFVLNKWETWNHFVTWADVKFFDLNNDGKADILGRDLGQGDWWASFSQGTTGLADLVGKWDPTQTWVDAQIGDVNKDGRTDIIGRLSGTGQVFASLNRASTQANGNPKLVNQTGPWTTLNDGNIAIKTTWLDVQAADFNGDGFLDFIGRVQRTGHWYVNFGTASKPVASTFWTAWNPFVTWEMKFGDVNGDGKADLIGHTLDYGDWWVGLSPATTTAQVSNVRFGAGGFFYTDVFIGDFNHDGKIDVAGIRTGTGEWSVGISSGADFSFSVWDAWPTNPARLTVRRGRFAS